MRVLVLKARSKLSLMSFRARDGKTSSLIYLPVIADRSQCRNEQREGETDRQSAEEGGCNVIAL